MRLDARGKAAAGVDGNRAVKLEWHGDGEDSADFALSKAIVEKSEFREYRRALTVADLLCDTRRKPSPLPLSQRRGDSERRRRRHQSKRARLLQPIRRPARQASVQENTRDSVARRA